MTDLTQLVQQQRTDQRKDCIAELHHQEITVIREMAQAHEHQLRQELKHLNKEIKEAHAQLQQEMENALICKQSLALTQHENEQLTQENQQLRERVQEGQERLNHLEHENQQL
jgi:predicted nuclease with TOPRIM domain